jgi:hypothetical protein
MLRLSMYRGIPSLLRPTLLSLRLALVLGLERVDVLSGTRTYMQVTVKGTQGQMSHTIHVWLSSGGSGAARRACPRPPPRGVGLCCLQASADLAAASAAARRPAAVVSTSTVASSCGS